MGKHTFREWMIAVRAWSFPASAMPVIVSTAYVYWKYRTGTAEDFVLWPAIAALVLMVVLHAAGLIALIPASKALRVMAGSRTAGLETVRALDAMTAQLQTVFSLLLAASFLLSALL